MPKTKTKDWYNVIAGMAMPLTGTLEEPTNTTGVPNLKEKIVDILNADHNLLNAEEKLLQDGKTYGVESLEAARLIAKQLTLAYKSIPNPPIVKLLPTDLEVNNSQLLTITSKLVDRVFLEEIEHVTTHDNIMRLKMFANRSRKINYIIEVEYESNKAANTNANIIRGKVSSRIKEIQNKSVSFNVDEETQLVVCGNKNSSKIVNCVHGGAIYSNGNVAIDNNGTLSINTFDGVIRKRFDSEQFRTIREEVGAENINDIGIINHHFYCREHVTLCGTDLSFLLTREGKFYFAKGDELIEPYIGEENLSINDTFSLENTSLTIRKGTTEIVLDVHKNAENLLEMLIDRRTSNIQKKLKQSRAYVDEKFYKLKNSRYQFTLNAPILNENVGAFRTGWGNEHEYAVGTTDGYLITSTTHPSSIRESGPMAQVRVFDFNDGGAPKIVYTKKCSQSSIESEIRKFKKDIIKKAEKHSIKFRAVTKNGTKITILLNKEDAKIKCLIAGKDSVENNVAVSDKGRLRIGTKDDPTELELGYATNERFQKARREIAKKISKTCEEDAIGIFKYEKSGSTMKLIVKQNGELYTGDEEYTVLLTDKVTHVSAEYGYLNITTPKWQTIILFNYSHEAKEAAKMIRTTIK